MILKPFSYLYDFLKLAQEHKNWPIHEIRSIGSRFSGKTWNFADFVCELMNTIDRNGEFIKATAFIIRAEKSDMEDLYDQYCQNLEKIILEQNVKTLNSKKIWTFENGNEVRFKHLRYKNKTKTVGAGWSSARGDYIVVIYEEAYEIHNTEFARVREAIRSANPNANILEVCICNPWDPRNYFIKNTLSNFPYNKNLIETFGEQKAIVNVKDEILGYSRPVIIHYANWRAIQKHRVSKTPTGFNVYTAIEPIIIPQSKLDQLTQNYALDYTSALVADYGCAGPSGTENIYFRLMNTITSPQYYQHQCVYGGGDIGNGRSKKSGKTAFVFVAGDPTGYIDVYSEYVWDNKISPKDPYIIAHDVIDFYLYQMDQYTRKTNHIFNYSNPLNVIVDLSESSFISILNTCCAERGIDFIEFVPCQKFRINDRIVIEQYLLAQGRIRIDGEWCCNLLDELSGAEWDDSLSEEPKRKNDKDHSINAFEYAIEPFMFDMVNDDDIERISRKLTKQGKRYL